MRIQDLKIENSPRPPKNFKFPKTNSVLFKFWCCSKCSLSNVFIRNMFGVGSWNSSTYGEHLVTILRSKQQQLPIPALPVLLQLDECKDGGVKRRRNCHDEGEISTFAVSFSAFLRCTRFNFALFQHCREEESHSQCDLRRRSDQKGCVLQTCGLWQYHDPIRQWDFRWTSKF